MITKKESDRIYYLKNRDKILKKNKEYRRKNKEAISKQKKNYNKKYYKRPEAKEKARIRRKKYVLNNPEKIKAYSKKYNSTRPRLFKKDERKGRTLEETYGIEKAAEIKKKISKTLKERKILPPNRKGCKLSKEVRMRLSKIAREKGFGKWMKGRKIPKSSIDKTSAALRGRKNPPLSEETKQRIREARAKQILPLKDTSIEVKIQKFLKQLEIPFFTHQYMDQIRHSYQCDIFIPSMNMVVECDGDYWHRYPTGREIDHIRTSELLSKGFKVLRLWECEIKKMNIGTFQSKLRDL